MVEVIVLGVAGVLQPVDAAWAAEVAAALQDLARNGLPAADFERRAWARMRAGEPAPLARAVRDRAPHWPPARVRALLQTVRDAVPARTNGPHLDALRFLRASHRLALLDRGPASRMEAWVAGLGVADLVGRRLWTDDLGAQARPPRSLAFRWLAERLDLRPRECLYVPGTSLLRQAALGAGWRVWGDAPDPSRCVDLEGLVAAVAEGALS